MFGRVAGTVVDAGVMKRWTQAQLGAQNGLRRLVLGPRTEKRRLCSVPERLADPFHSKPVPIDPIGGSIVTRSEKTKCRSVQFSTVDTVCSFRVRTVRSGLSVSVLSRLFVSPFVVGRECVAGLGRLLCANWRPNNQGPTTNTGLNHQKTGRKRQGRNWLTG